MGKIIKFDPQGSDCEENLACYIKAAKALPFIAISNIVWEANTWDLTGLAKPERASLKPTVRFDQKGSSHLSDGSPMGEFARAFVAFKIGENFGTPRQVGKFTKPVVVMRILVEVMAAHGQTDLSEISPAILDATVDHIKAQGGKSYGIAQRVQGLEWVARSFNATGVLRSPFDWSVGNTNARLKSRINQFDDDRNFTNDELEAVAEAFWLAKTPRQQIITSVLALLCCAPARISEILALPVDCDVVLDPGDGYQAGLRWWPKKGGAPQVKFIPKAMIPVAQEALTRIKLHTESARRLARAVMNGEAAFARLPNGWPNLPGDTPLPYDRALMIAHPFTLSESGKTKSKNDCIEPITYHHIMGGLQGQEGVATVFEELGIRLPDGSPLLVNTHKPRHYLNTLANKASVPQTDIALWSGRKSIHQNSVYDHETARELLVRIKNARGSESIASVPIDDQSAFDIAQIKETAHTTQFGWCAQSLRQNPCQMFGECLNCSHLVCIKGAAGKLSNIKRELDRERQLLAKAEERIAGGLRISPAWIEIFERKISRLAQLVEILESNKVIDGSPVMMRKIDQIPQFDPVAPGRFLAGNGLPKNEKDT